MGSIINEKEIAEKILFAVSEQTSSLTIRRQEISEFCQKNNARFTAVITFIGDFLEPDITNFNSEPLSYKLTQKGLNFISKGCWSGIERAEEVRLLKEKEEKEKEIKLLISENKKNRKLTLIVGIIGGLFAIGAGLIALLD